MPSAARPLQSSHMVNGVRAVFMANENMAGFDEDEKKAILDRFAADIPNLYPDSETKRSLKSVHFMPSSRMTRIVIVMNRMDGRRSSFHWRMDRTMTIAQDARNGRYG